MIYKSINRAVTFILIAMSAATSMVVEQAGAQTAYPSKPVTIILPFGPGSGTDTVIQAIKPEIESQLGVPVVISHQPGAGGQVGTVAIANATPDGYTFGMSTVSTMATNFVFKKQTYGHDNFKFITRIGFIPRALVVHREFPAQTYSQFVDKVTKIEKPYFYGVTTNSVDQLDMELLKKTSPLQLTAVTYSDVGTTYKMDFVSGRVPVTYISLSLLSSFASDSNSRVLAITGQHRHPDYPQVPTFKEIGIADLTKASFYGFIAPSGVSSSQIDTLNRALTRALKMPSAILKLKNLGVVSAPNTPEEHRLEALETLTVYTQLAINLKIQP
jgi:tripartite-type tricarboxylate transporter receptor subunit TctC